MTVLRNIRISDNLGNEAEVGVFGSLKVAETTAQIAKTFDRKLDTKMEFLVGSAGTGTYQAQYNRSLLKVSAGASAGGSAYVETHDVLRYKPGTTIQTYFTASFHGVGAGKTAYIGLFDIEDGVYLGYNGANFVVGYRNTNNGADVQQVVDMSAYDMTKIHRFRIKFGYLGVGDISYEIMSNRAWHEIHIFPTDGTLSERTHIGSPILPIRAQVDNGAVAADIYIVSGSWNAQTWDKNTDSQDKPYFVGGQRTITPAATTFGTPLVAFVNVGDTIHSSLNTALGITAGKFQGYRNKVHNQLLFAEFATSSEGLHQIVFWKLPPGSIVQGTPGTDQIGSTFVYADSNTATEGDTPLVTNDGNAITVGATFVTNIIGTALNNKPAFNTNIAVQSSGTGVAAAALDFERFKVRANPGDEYLITVRNIAGAPTNQPFTWSIAYLDLV